MPVSATINATSGAWSCTFDQSLEPGVLNAGNWSIVASGSEYTVTSATASSNVVSGASTIAIESGEADQINFAPPPFDVTNAIGQETPAFASFPIIVT